MRPSRPVPARALVLFDIDGTLIRRAGPHHRAALEDAVRHEMGIETTTADINTAGMLDQDILIQMLRNAGVAKSRITPALPLLMERAQALYEQETPSLRRKVCPGVHRLLHRLKRAGVPALLVTGNLTRIGWRKMELAGLREHFAFGAFAEGARTRAGLAKIAIQHARRNGWVDRHSRISLIGDHPNDVQAAHSNGIQAVAVATGVTPAEVLSAHAPDVLVSDLRGLELEMLL